jgi:hypothetical protein
MVRLTETFHWMFEDERWRYKFLFQSLILLIPVVGQVALLGWTMSTCENLLVGRQDVARSGLHLRRGAQLLLIGVVYWIGMGIPYTALRYLATLGPGAGAVADVAEAYNDVALLCYPFLLVPALVATDRGGILAGLDLPRVAGSIVARPGRTAVAGIVVLVAVIIAIAGFAVIVAAPFTITYAASIVAGTAAWWALPAERPAVDSRSPDGRPVPFRPPQMEPDAERP